LKQEALLAPYFERLAERPSWRWQGRVVQANGQTVESAGPSCSVGECCEIVDADGVPHEAEVIGFRGPHVLAMPLDATQGVRYGDAVRALGVAPRMGVGEAMQGRVLDALGRPMDGLGEMRLTGSTPLMVQCRWRWSAR
jgi:flagellum-specific ATP synthase